MASSSSSPIGSGPAAAGASACGAAAWIASSGTAATTGAARVSRRATLSASAASSARISPKRISRSPVFVLVAIFALVLQWHQAMLLGRPQFALGAQILERARHVPAGERRLDHRIHQTAPGGHVRIRECLAILRDQLLALRRLVPGFLNFLAEYDLRRALRTHHGHFRGGPCED